MKYKGEFKKDMNTYSHYKNSLEEIIDTDVNKSEWKLIRKLHLPKKYNNPSSGEIKKGVVIDVEATGLSIGHDDVIQLALLPFDYEVPSGKILSIRKEEAFNGLREPKIPITEEASLITGITNEMVKNKSIKSEEVEDVLRNVDLVIAHNALYDRQMVEPHWECFKNISWACTFKSIDWLQEGFGSAKLENLGANYGWFYDGHDAFNDCEACLALLSETLPKKNKTVFSELREYASNPSFLIKAIDAPYNKRNILKRKGYKWRPADLLNGKVWWTETDDYEAEIKWLNEEIYNREINIPIKRITALNRYSDRIWE